MDTLPWNPASKKRFFCSSHHCLLLAFFFQRMFTRSNKKAEGQALRFIPQLQTASLISERRSQKCHRGRKKSQQLSGLAGFVFDGARDRT
jgi:hypothetical protein